MPAVSIIIVNFNGAHLLPDCFNSLAAQTFQDFEVVLVDNGSRDNSLAQIERLPLKPRLIALTQNTGFATGNNIGIQAATGKYIVLLNNDTQVDRCFVAELIKPVEADPQVGMVAPKILNFFDREVIDSVGGLLLTPDGIGQGRGRGERDQGQYDNLTECLLPSGCAALYRKSVLDQIGVLDDSFFAYCEDAELGLRAVWAGWHCANAPKAIVFHKYSASSSAYSPLKMRLVERNHYGLALKCFPFSMLLTLPFWTLYRYVVMARVLRGGKGKGAATAGGQTWTLLKAFVQGHLEALWRAPGQFCKRLPARKISARQFKAIVRRHQIGLDKVFQTD